MVTHGTISRARLVASGTSCSTSTALRAGIKTVRTPFWCAAMSFSFRPPTGSTRPRRDTSPVIATSPRTGRPLNKLTSAVHMATPALGPSLGMAPCGKWMCTLRPRSRPSPPSGPDASGSESMPFATMPPYARDLSRDERTDADGFVAFVVNPDAYIPPGDGDSAGVSRDFEPCPLSFPPDPGPPAPPLGASGAPSPSARACDCTQLSAMSALSLMTSPSWPVSCMSPFPGITAASMYMRSPPTAVHDRPATTPGISPRSRRSVLALSYRGGPKTFVMSSCVTTGTPDAPRRPAEEALAIATDAGCMEGTALVLFAKRFASSCAPAACTAAARQSASRHLCSPRTPASRVYPRTTVSMASMGISSLGVGRSSPCSSRTRGTTCFLAMRYFSSAV
mmetsp:Transcript_11672/g.48947  ORF Transcript_11672/g.48947 Transcript_11672/m.48947 type:complete len:394 (-) Transcript_11672:1931-3112(-)